MKITAVIPIRKGSQRVKNKNLKPFAGTTLLENKVRVLLQVPELDEIVINTDSEAAIDLVESRFQEAKIRTQKRESYFASSECSGSEFFRHLGEVTNTDVFVYAPCTSPLVKPATISSCIRKFMEDVKDGSHDSVASATLVKEFLWLNGTALNYDPCHAPNSQDLPDVLALNFAVSVIGRDDLINKCNIIGNRPDFVVTSDVESIDIDTPLDFYLAEQLYLREGRLGMANNT